jgi:hypothetical protein
VVNRIEDEQMTEEERGRREAAVRRVRERIRSYEATHPHMKDFGEFLEEFNKETERGAALSAAAFIDALLERILAAFLISNDSGFDLISGNGPLRDFAAKAQACHAMGLISEEEFKECGLIRKVRNEFAHKVKMSFDNDKVKGLCSSMKYAAKPYRHVTVSTRGKFTTAAVGLILNLTNRPHYVGKKALTYQEWPR